MRTINFTRIRRQVGETVNGTHMLAFLPALCLAAYWGGGEILLVGVALFTPLLYALTGGFQLNVPNSLDAQGDQPVMARVAQDFLEIAQHHGQTTACFYFGISGYDDIARTLGDVAADDARRLVAERLKSALRSGDQVYQMGDSRVAVFIAPGFRLKLDGLLDLSKRLRATVEEPLSVCSTTQFLHCAIGIASSLNFPRNTNAETWIASSAQALAEAEANGLSATRVWSDKLSQTRNVRRVLREDLAGALEKGQIQAHFQPQVSLSTGNVVGMEALARWDHPTRGIIAPADFLRALRESGEMERLGKTMLAQALATQKRWDRAGLDVPTIGVNFSDIELRNPSVPSQIQQELDRFGFPGHRLAIELSEVGLTENDDILIRNLGVLSEIGCRIDLDDFGTGHASLPTLQGLSVKRVKIDQSLLRGSETQADKKRVLCATLALADHLGLETLVEGVETVSEHGLLQSSGCQFAQGFLFAHPMDVDASEAWLRENQAARTKGESTRMRRIK